MNEICARCGKEITEGHGTFPYPEDTEKVVCSICKKELEAPKITWRAPGEGSTEHEIPEWAIVTLEGTFGKAEVKIDKLGKLKADFTNVINR